MVAIVALADRLKKQIVLRLVLAEISDLIDDHHFRMHQLIDLPVKPVVGERHRQPTGHIHDIGEAGAMPQLARQNSQGNRQVRLSDPCRPQEDEVSALIEKAPRRQLLDEPGIDAGLRVEVKVGETFLDGELGELQIEFHLLSVALLHLAREQVTRIRWDIWIVISLYAGFASERHFAPNRRKLPQKALVFDNLNWHDTRISRHI